MQDKHMAGQASALPMPAVDFAALLGLPSGAAPDVYDGLCI